MMIRTRWRRRLERRLDEIKDLANRALAQSPEVIEELRSIARHPRSLGAWLEAHSPWLNRRFLGAASNVIEPFMVGMGFRVEKVGEDVVEVVLPGGWRNQGEQGAIHSAALSALGELSAKLYWEHHLDLRAAELESTRVQVRLLARPRGEVKAVFRLPVSDREAILHRLRAESLVSTETETLIYDGNGRLVAEVQVDWELRRRLLLGAGAGSGSGSGSDSGE